MASLMFDDNGAIRFRSRSNQHHKEQTAATVTAIMPGFASAIPTNRASGFGLMDAVSGDLKAVFDALISKVMNFVLKSDDNYTLDIADAELCEAEYYHLLRIVGAYMDEFKSSPLKIYFDSSQHSFEKTIWSSGDLNKYVENIVAFCASAKVGHVNMTALTNILSTLLKTEVSQERTSINKSETIIVYSERDKECGAIKLHFTGDQIKAKDCCSEGTNARISVQKDMIMFKDSKELLLTLRTFVAEHRR